jgi:dTDP-4-amino-4,6-dideoxygalactose transaminase
VTAIGAVPRLVDIDLATFNIDPAKIPAAITKKTKAILAVHLYGQPADLTSIIRFIEKSGRKIPVVEDCAQAHGAEVLFAGPARHPQIIKRVGSLGQVACFSFYPTKNLGCFGDGGMVVTNNSEIYERVRLLRMYGEKRRYESVLLGRNSRLDELQAAILLVKLKYLDKWNERRRQIAELYISQFTGPKANIELPFEAEYAKHVYHLFVIRTQKRDTLKKYLEERGMQTAIHYPIPIHLVPSMKFLGYKRGDFPRAEKASHDVLSLPIYPELTDGEVKRVAETSKQFFTT